MFENLVEQNYNIHILYYFTKDFSGFVPLKIILENYAHVVLIISKQLNKAVSATNVVS